MELCLVGKANRPVGHFVYATAYALATRHRGGSVDVGVFAGGGPPAALRRPAFEWIVAGHFLEANTASHGT